MPLTLKPPPSPPSPRLPNPLPLLVLLLLVLAGPAAAIHPQAESHIPRTAPTRPSTATGMTGINLGGWLVLEPWMSLRSKATREAPRGCSSELCISQYWARNLTSAPPLPHPRPPNVTGNPAHPPPPVDYASIDYSTHPITLHRKNFISDWHLDTLQRKGIKFLRLSLGHWATSHDPVYPYVPGVLRHVDWLMVQAQKRDMSVLMSMHAAVGGQNPWEHSCAELPEGHGFCHNQTNQDTTVRRLKEWAVRYRTSPALWGIEVLNEPVCGANVLTSFYQTAYDTIRSVSQDIYVVISPNVYGQSGDVMGPSTHWANRDMLHWAHWLGARSRVALDMHHYHSDWMIGPVHANMTIADHIVRLNVVKQRLSNFLQVNGTALVIGEWSPAGPLYNASNWRVPYAEFSRKQVEVFSMPGILANTAWSARVDYNAMWGVMS